MKYLTKHQRDPFPSKNQHEIAFVSKWISLELLEMLLDRESLHAVLLSSFTHKDIMKEYAECL